MKRIAKISIIAAAAVAVVTTISGCSHFRSPEHRAERMVEKVTSKLELTETQQVTLKSLSDEMLSTRKSMKLKFDDSRKQMQALFEQTTLDQDKVLNIIKSHTQMMDDHAPVMVSLFANFYDSLNADQQEEVREFIQQRDDHSRRWGSHGLFGEH